MARGTPVIALDVGGRRELVRTGESGWLLEADGRSLAATMDRILRKPSEADGLRASARAHFLETFTAERNAEIFRRLFAELKVDKQLCRGPREDRAEPRHNQHRLEAEVSLERDAPDGVRRGLETSLERCELAEARAVEAAHRD